MIDTSAIPESVRQRLLAESVRMTRELFRDPKVRAEYRDWLAKRKDPQKGAP